MADELEILIANDDIVEVELINELLVVVELAVGAPGAPGAPGSDADALRAARILSAAGDTEIEDDDDIVVVKKTIGEVTQCLLPEASARDRPATIKDGRGDADSNNITITPFGAETIDGATEYVLTFSFQAVTLYPYPDGSGWYVL